LPHEVAGVFSHPNYLEVTHARAEKALAVCRIAESLGIHRNAVAAIGDGDNDLGLFAYAAYSIAMGNATDRLKWRADAVTSDNNSNGLAEAIDAIRSRWGLTLPAAPRCIPGETHLPLPDLDPEPL
jgi:hydroxymethylpyrimidine pyrophosphatase-like HAD family hydrolase